MGQRKVSGRQYAVIGLGRFGSSVAKTLYGLGNDVLAIDIDEERMQELMNEVTHAVVADATDENALKSLGLRNFDIVIVAIGVIQPSILATLIVKDLGVEHIVAKAVSDVHGKVLAKVGATRVVYPERDMGVRVAHNLVSGNLIDYIALAPGYSIVEVEAPREFVGKTLKDLDFRRKFGINIVAIRRGDELGISPGPDDVLEHEDILVAMGQDEMLEHLDTLGAEGD